jgi:hypothetical protein
LVGQIEQLAKDVGRTFGAEWHRSPRAHRAFLEAMRLLFAEVPVPESNVGEAEIDPVAAAQVIFNRFIALSREYEEQGQKSFGQTSALAMFGSAMDALKDKRAAAKKERKS